MGFYGLWAENTYGNCFPVLYCAAVWKHVAVLLSFYRTQNRVELVLVTIYTAALRSTNFLQFKFKQ